MDNDPNVAAWVKNDHLGFEVLYVYRGWVQAVNAHGGFGCWCWAVAREPGEIRDILAKNAKTKGKG
jgi:type III restriction enzyme